MPDGSGLHIVETADAWPTNLSFDLMRESVMSAIGSTTEGSRSSNLFTPHTPCRDRLYSHTARRGHLFILLICSSICWAQVRRTVVEDKTF